MTDIDKACTAHLAEAAGQAGPIVRSLMMGAFAAGAEWALDRSARMDKLGATSDVIRDTPEEAGATPCNTS